MSSEDWQIVGAAFKQASGLQGEARTTFLREFEARHPNLAGRLQPLLAADARDGDPMADSIAASITSLSGEIRDPWIGRTFGAWTITSRLADGGMGAVFLADRADAEYKQTAAFKVMAAQLLVPEAITRFKAERQILATLHHPYIANLLDGGSTNYGLPYLVMEYVQGLPVDSYCDEKHLSIDARLALFRKVCEAVDYAHRNLIVHRDLKPSNILIDREGNPKLLDFGIAKLLEADAFAPAPAQTREGMRPMTPEYASPEQIRGDSISVATDVYALGVLLYRLMTGQSPYGVSPSTPHQYQAAILQRDPIKPSTRIATAEEGAGIACDIPPARLRRRLAGDLDNIALRALQKDPQRRYATVSALSADVGRYLAQQPVEARGDDWPYKARKFVARNIRGLAFTATMLVTVAALVVYYTVRLTHQRDRANLAAAESSEVASFLTNLFQSASPQESKGTPVTAVELLQQGRKRINALDNQPALQAELMRIMGSSMTAMGDLDESIPMLERSLRMKEARHDADQLSISQSTHDLAEAYRLNGQLEQAEAYERRTLQIARKALGAQSNEVAYVMSRLGVILFDERKTSEALDIERRALDILVRSGAGESSNAIDIRGNMANALSTLGRYRESEALHRQTIALSRRVDGDLAPNTVIRISNLGLVLVRLNKLEEAASLFRKNIERGIKVWGPNYSHIAFMYDSLGAVLGRLGHMDEAMVAYRKAQEITRGNVGENHVRYVRRLISTASGLLAMGQYARSRAMFQTALDKAVLLEGPDGYNAARARVFLGKLDIDRGRNTSAVALLRRALAHEDVLPRSLQLTARMDLGDALSRQGHSGEAARLLQQAVAGQQASVGADNAGMLPFLGALAAHYRRDGELGKSLQIGERIAHIIDSDPGPLLWNDALALAEYGKTLDALDRDEAGTVLEAAFAILRKTFGDTDPRVRALAPLAAKTQARATR